MMSIAGAMAANDAQARLGDSVQFFFGDQPTPPIATRISSDKTSQKTNGVGKSDEFGCKWAALSALIAFQNSAKRNGANAVVDLVSFYKKNESKNDTTFECHAGTMIIGVALKGSYANISE